MLVDTKSPYRFKVTPKPGTGKPFTVEIDLTQAEFEDYQGRRVAIHAKIAARGVNPAETVWSECPPVDEAVERELRKKIGCAPSSQLIAYYPHGWQHDHYKRVEVGGVVYRYMGFQSGHFIKYAPEVQR